MTNKKRAIITVTNDLTTDQRVHKIALTLSEIGYDVMLIGRKLSYSQPSQRNYSTKRFSLFFNKGFLFYANYNIRLFFYLLFSKKHNLIWSVDLDSLLACYTAAKFKNSRLVYDSHELFTEVPELSGRPFVKNIWLRLESYLLPRLKYAFTVSQPIADIYFSKYKTSFYLLRNLPFYIEIKNKYVPGNIILYQGAININRGLEELILSMKMVNNAKLILIGSGDIERQIRDLILENNLTDIVEMKGKIPFEELHDITQSASIGVSLEKDVCESYKYSLPNKFFDYIMAEIPVLVSKLPETEKLVAEFKIGEIVQDVTPEVISAKLNSMLADKIQLIEYHKNCKKAKNVLNWDNEKQVISKVLE